MTKSLAPIVEIVHGRPLDNHPPSNADWSPQIYTPLTDGRKTLVFLLASVRNLPERAVTVRSASIVDTEIAPASFFGGCYV